MVALNARFDGKVIVPDEPLNLPANQRVRINVELLDNEAPLAAHPASEFHALIGLGLQGPANPHPGFPDEDSLWEKRPE